MSGTCCDPVCTQNQVSPRFRKALWTALVVNAAMFAVEVIGGATSGSASLWADSLDFAGDAANYGISLTVISMGLAWRSRTAMIKGLTMTGFGVIVLAKTIWAVMQGAPPEPMAMGVIGSIALLANAGVALMLYTFRNGDANMRSVWLCSRNDAIGNIAVMLAAAGVWGTGSVWPDVLVATIIASLALWSGIAVVRQAKLELMTTRSGFTGHT